MNLIIEVCRCSATHTKRDAKYEHDSTYAKLIVTPDGRHHRNLVSLIPMCGIHCATCGILLFMLDYMLVICAVLLRCVIWDSYQVDRYYHKARPTLAISGHVNLGRSPRDNQSPWTYFSCMNFEIFLHDTISYHALTPDQFRSKAWTKSGYMLRCERIHVLIIRDLDIPWSQLLPDLIPPHVPPL